MSTGVDNAIAMALRVRHEEWAAARESLDRYVQADEEYDHLEKALRSGRLSTEQRIQLTGAKYRRELHALNLADSIARHPWLFAPDPNPTTTTGDNA